MRALLLPALLIVAATLTGCGGDETATPTTVTVTAPPPAAASPSTTTAPVQDLEIPDVEGKNGAIALDELERAGFTNVQAGSADEQDTVVINAANWKVVSIEPGAGETIPSDSTVVLTMTKQ
ncbi:PASTA domain-containing protein [Pseudonocardia sp. ICBG1034]|jgi:hypothetical protein|uniref:PASTA domain-containing protein n=1 Tax=Pseudonocardia sp. ICBG1034 TaxID=2844381 RepID=UPI001CCF42BF|nr:PASTA domain-containing protein [Pseudonocardia sp. ICBG1034]